MTATPLNAHRDRTLFGVAMIVLAVFLMSFQDAVIKLASTDLSLWQVFVIRSLIAMPILLVIALASGAADRLLPRSFGWSLLRSVLLVGMYVFLYAAVPVLSLSVVAAAFYTGPLFITVLSVLIAGEPVGARRWIAVTVGFAGVLVILQPGTDGFTLIAVLPVLSGLFYALAAITTRMKCLDDSPMSLALSLNLVLLGVGALASVAIIVWQPTAIEAGTYPFMLGHWAEMGAREWLVVGLLAVLIVGIGITLAQAYQAASPVVVATFDYSYLVFAAIWSYVIFSEPPAAGTILGMSLIVGAGLMTVRD